MSITLFAYDPTLTVAGLGGTFTRADASTCATYVDSNGVVQTVAANVLRNSHYVNGVRTTLLEGSRTNSALGSALFSDSTYWANSAGFTIVTATSCISGQTAWKHTGSGARNQTVGTFVNGQKDCCWFILEASTAPSSDVGIWDNTASAWLVLARMTWASNTVAITAGSGTCGAVALGNGRYVVWVVGTGTGAGTGAAGNTRQAYCYPAPVSGASIIHAGCFEANAAFPSSYIPTTASAVTRAADALSFPFLPVPQAMTVYADGYYNVAADATTNYHIAHFGTGSATAPYAKLRIGGALTNVSGEALHHNGSALVDQFAAATLTYGDRAEHRGVFAADGSALAGISINAAAEVVSAASAANTFAAAWSATTLTIGTTQATTQSMFGGIKKLVIASGVQSLATMRTLTATSGVVSATLAPSSVVAEGAWYAQPAYTVLDTGTATALQASAVPTNTNQQVRVLRLDVTCSAAPAAGTIVNIQDGGTVLWQGVLSAGSRKLTVDFTRKPLRGSRGATVTAEMASAGGSVVQTIVMTCDTVRAP